VEHILLSSSMDRSLFLWACTGTTTNHANVWTPLTRVGSAGGILGGSIGSSLLGFVQARLEPVHGKSLVGHAYGGALHIWSLQDLAANNGGDNITDPVSSSDAAAMEDIAQLRKWEATSCVTGHFAGVADLCWEAELGAYLLTVSIDQTCRLWALVSGKNTANESESVWVELARPQVHGYDLTAIASLSTSVHRHLMASGADEKEIRIYDAPMTTIRTLRACCQQGVRSAEDNVTRVERAYIPSLGLSNKVSAADGAEEDSGETDSSTATRFQLPLERDLGAVSLWPEVRKLFGHTTETYCLASTVGARTGLLSFATSPFANDVLLASSAKARDVEAANIRIWDVQEGKCMQVLEGGHKSTVATMSFSPDGKLLASSGKDRRLCIWRRSENDTSDGSSSHKQLFHVAAAIDSAHKRIIWGVHFCPFNPLLLASGSRDGVVKLWQISENESDPLQVDSKESFGPNTKIDKKKSDAVTALSFAPIPFYNHAVLALGLECGQIELWNISLSPEAPLRPTFLYCIPPNQCHVASVTTLAWKPHRQPTSEDDDSVALVLASSAMDHGCRIIKVIISK
jgi:elongator complex protein 2